MYKDWPALATALSDPLKQLRGATPDVMKGFSGLARAALEAKVLDKKTKELIALGISVAIRCEPCITFHAEAAVAQGATREEISETMGMAIYMGAGPAVMYAAKGLEAFDQYSQKVSAKAAE